MVIVLAALAVASSVPLLVFSVFYGRLPSGRISHNLTVGLAVPEDARQAVLARPVAERAFGPIFRYLAGLGRRLTPGGAVEALERRLRLAGDPWSVERIMTLKVALMTIAAGTSLARAVADPSPASVLLVPAAVVIALLIPESIVSRKATERQAKILLSLPDTMDQLTVCVEAGLAFDAALTRVALGSEGPLGEEIRHVLQDVQIGLPRREALNRVLERTDVPELRQLVHAIGQADNYGVPVASVLRAQAIDLRQKRAMRAEERAQKMPVKLVFPLVFCILPSLFVVVLGPAALRVSGMFSGT